MSETSANLSMPYLMPAQAQKHVTHNEALRVLDGAVQLAVESRAQATPPAAPPEGGRWLVAAGASGAWDGQAGQIALFDAGSWVFLTPRAGWRLYDRETGALLVFDGSAWRAPRGQTDDLPGIGVNATSDAVNRLSVSAPATLLSHEGAGHQLKLNKAGAGDTGSLLFQTGWSGRAEMGLAGSDAFAIKVSADGAQWHETLRGDPASGRAVLPSGAEIAGTLTGTAVTQGPGDVTPGRVIRGEDGYVRASVVGAVAQANGVSTGAILEAGSNAGGSYLRLADGTQICTHVLSAGSSKALGAGTYANPWRTADFGWIFPAAFSAPPVVTGTVMGDDNGAGRHHALTVRYTTAAGIASANLVRLSGGTVELSPEVALMAVGRWV